MRGRADALLADGYASVLSDLLGDFRGRQHTADAGFGALTELQRDSLDQLVRSLVRELLRIERAITGAGTEIARTELPNHVGAPEVIGGQPAWSRVVSEPALAGPVVQCAQGIGRQSSEAHGGDIHQSHLVGLR